MEPIMIEGTWRKRLLASKLKVPAKYKYQGKWPIPSGNKLPAKSVKIKGKL